MIKKNKETKITLKKYNQKKDKKKTQENWKIKFRYIESKKKSKRFFLHLLLM